MMRKKTDGAESRRLRLILAHFTAADAPPATGGAGHADAVVDASKAFHPLKELNSPGRITKLPQNIIYARHAV